MSSESAWMLPLNAFRWIEQNIPHGSTILEFGSGEGSKLLMNNYDLFSVEHNPEWLRLNDKKCLYAPIKINDKFPGEIGWYDLELIKKNLPSQIDLMIIDGPIGTIGRSGILDYIEYFSWNFTILIDDLQREQESLFSQKLCRKIQFECIHFDETEENKGFKRSFGVFQKRRIL